MAGGWDEGGWGIEAVWGFPVSSAGKESACNAGDPGLIPGLGRSSGEGNSYPLQYSCLENSMDRGDFQATVLLVSELEMTEQRGCGTDSTS